MGQSAAQLNPQSPWHWVPSVYFAEGLPYAIITVVSVIFYTRMGLSNAEATLYTGWLYLPWVIKPLWSPWVDLLRTKRYWIVAMQFCLGAAFAGIALTLPAADFVRYSLVFFWLAALASATHDIAADGYYMLALPASDQAWFVGIRNVCYRLAWITGQGLLVIAAGLLEERLALKAAWTWTFAGVAAVFFSLALYHTLRLPRAVNDAPRVQQNLTRTAHEVLETVASFFRRDHIGLILAFLLLFRFAEAQIARLTAPFLLDTHTNGGLALSTTEVGFATGVTGVITLLLGGITGGLWVTRRGLKTCLPWMVAAINLPNVVYLLLAWHQTTSLIWINMAIAIEQFGYGFGFTAYLLVMMQIADGKYKTAHYAICTGFMALGMMLPGMWSGWVADCIGYRHFFVWVLCSAIPGFIIAMSLKVDPNFGKKTEAVKKS